jgi:SAM-dependent methyltransferase
MVASYVLTMLSCLKEPSLVGLSPGTLEFFAAQKALILARPLMKRNYDDWYRRLLEDARSAPASGVILELGSGGSYLKDLEPAIVTSDVGPNVADRVIDARSLPFADESLRALLLTHVFHHIPDVDAFFKEAQRALIPGGVISMIEVAHTPFARFFFRHFHHEPYEDACQEWSFAQRDSMMDSNQALAWMVFARDRCLFERRYPLLAIERLAFMPWLTYLVAGGVTARYLIPKFMTGLFIGTERLLQPLQPVFSLHWHICVRKKRKEGLESDRSRSAMAEAFR